MGHATNEDATVQNERRSLWIIAFVWCFVGLVLIVVALQQRGVVNPREWVGNSSGTAVSGNAVGADEITKVPAGIQEHEFHDRQSNDQSHDVKGADSP